VLATFLAPRSPTTVADVSAGEPPAVEKSTAAEKSPAAEESTAATGTARPSLLIGSSFLALFAIVGLCLYGLPYYYDFFVKDLGWTRTTVTSGNAVGKLVVGPLFGFAAGWIIDRVGPRPPMIVGILLAGAALFGLGGVEAVPFFFFFSVLNALGYVLAGPLPNQVLLARGFGEGRGRAMGIAYLGIGLGGFAAPHLSNALIEAAGWRSALKILGGIVVLVALPLVLIQRPRGDATKPVAARQRPPLRSLFKSRSFYLLALGSMASIGAVGGAFQNLKLLLSIDQQRTQDEAKWILSTILLVSLIGRVLAGELADRFGPKRVMLFVYLLVTAALIILASGATGSGIYVFALVFGLGLGGEYLIIPLVAAELFGAAALGSVMGIILTADGVAEALMPSLVAKLRDSTGSYTLSFQLLAGLAALGAVAVACLPATRPRGVAGSTSRLGTA
jgi:MFS family permease